MMRMKGGREAICNSYYLHHTSPETIIWGGKMIFFSFPGLSNIENSSTSNSVGGADKVHHQSQKLNRENACSNGQSHFSHWTNSAFLFFSSSRDIVFYNSRTSLG